MSKDIPISLAEKDHVVSRRKVLKWTSQAMAVAAGSAFLNGCGGGGGGGSSNPGPQGENGAGKPGDPVSPEQRVAALAAVKDEYARLCNGEISCSSRAVADFMLKMTAFQKVAIMPDGCVWGLFTDGQNYVVGNNLSKGSGSPRMPQQLNIKANETFADPPGSGLPPGGEAWGLSSFRNFAYPDGSIYEAADGEYELRYAGYEVPERLSPHISILKKLPELDALFWFTHGGMINLDGSINHAFMSLTLTELEDILFYTQDLHAGNLIYYLGQHGFYKGKWESDTFFAITPKFITAYNWRFTEDSIVVIHACASDNAPFRAAFRQAGAALYGGWNKPVWVHAAATAMAWMVNYFTAVNEFVPTPNPRDRAYDYLAIKKYCDAEEVTLYNDPTEGGDVVFNFTKFRGEPGGIAPSIHYVTIQEQLGRVTLHGSFGSTRGKVLIGTTLERQPGIYYLPFVPAGRVTELNVIEWSPGEIVAEIPPTGPGSAGYIGVQSGNRKSNTRAISRWTGQLNIVGKGYGTLAIHEELAFTFRADVGLQRRGPGEPLFHTLGAYTGTPFDAPTYWKWTAGGSHSATRPGPATIQVDWNGNGQIDLLREPNPQGKEFFAVAGTISRQENEVRMFMTGGALDALPVKATITDPNGTQTLNSRHHLGLPAALAAVEGQKIGIKMTLNEDLSIALGEIRVTEPTVIPMADDRPLFEYTIKWDKIEAEYKPDPYGGI